MMTDQRREDIETKYLDILYGLIDTNIQEGAPLVDSSMKAFELIQLHNIAASIREVRAQLYLKSHGF